MAAHIDPALILRLQKALGVSRREVYRRIQDTVNTFHIDLRPAALLLASQHRVNTARFATSEDRTAVREALRGVGGAAAPEPGPVASPAPPTPPPRRGGLSARRGRGGRRAETSVWLVHGRDSKAANELRTLLRALGLNPLEWTQAVARTREGAPYVGTVLDKGIGGAAATVVLLTPDDEARLRVPFRAATDPSHETRLTPQPRLNVVFEAGMAIGRDAKRTVLVQIGQVRPFSNIAGRHVVHLDGSPESRRDLATKLKGAGCTVNTEGTDWLSHGDFDQLGRRATASRPRRKRGRGAR